MKNWFLEGFKYWWLRFKRTKIVKIWTLMAFAVLFYGLSGGYFSSVFFWLAMVFAAYPMLIFAIALIYAWVVNPIREAFPNSWVAKVLIEKIFDNVRKL